MDVTEYITSVSEINTPSREKRNHYRLVTQNNFMRIVKLNGRLFFQFFQILYYSNKENNTVKWLTAVVEFSCICVGIGTLSRR